MQFHTLCCSFFSTACNFPVDAPTTAARRTLGSQTRSKSRFSSSERHNCSSVLWQSNFLIQELMQFSPTNASGCLWFHSPSDQVVCPCSRVKWTLEQGNRARLKFTPVDPQRDTFAVISTNSNPHVRDLRIRQHQHENTMLLAVPDPTT